MKLVFIVLNLAFLAFICYSIWKHDHSPLRKFFWPALIFKLTAGIFLGLIYTYYYTIGDTFGYFEDGKTLARIARTDFGSYLSFLWAGDETSSIWPGLIFIQPRALFFSKITSIFCLLSNDNYWIVCIYYSFISFLSGWYLVKKIIVFYPETMIAAVLSFLFFPSVVFWGSGLIKESFALAGLFFLSSMFLKAWNKQPTNVIEWLLILLSLWIVWKLKYYYLAVFLPVVITALITRILVSRFKIANFGGEIALWCGILLIPSSLVSVLHPNFYPYRLMDVVVSSNQEFQMISNSQDLIHYHELQATVGSIIQNIPLALVSGIFRPFITEAHGLLQIFGAIENLFLLVLFLFAIPAVTRIARSKHRLLAFSTIVFIAVLCVFLALSTPNYGTLSRYRVGFLPFFVFMLTIQNALINKMMTSKVMRRLVR
jgi:hypothetical protein